MRWGKSQHGVMSPRSTADAQTLMQAALDATGTQRERIGLLLGQIRDLETDYAQDAAQRIADLEAENLALKALPLTDTNGNQGSGISPPPGQ